MEPNNKCNDKYIDFLKIKTDVSVYRIIFLGLFCFFVWASIISLKYNSGLVEVLSFWAVTILCGFSVVFSEQFMSFLHLPHGILFAYKDKLVYKTKRKQKMYKISEIKIVFIPFIKDLTGASRIHISLENGDTQIIALTTKQYKKLIEFINE